MNYEEHLIIHKLLVCVKRINLPLNRISCNNVLSIKYSVKEL
jgi:hypothetical protein